MEARLGDDNVQARGSKLILGTLEAYKTTLSAPKAKLEQAAEELRNAAAWAEAVPPLVEWILKPTDPIAAELVEPMVDCVSAAAHIVRLHIELTITLDCAGIASPSAPPPPQPTTTGAAASATAAAPAPAPPTAAPAAKAPSHPLLPWIHLLTKIIEPSHSFWDVVGQYEEEQQLSSSSSAGKKGSKGRWPRRAACDCGGGPQLWRD